MIVNSRRNLLIIIGTAFAFSSFFPLTTRCAPHPNIYLNQGEIDAIKAKVQAGQEPWKSAYARMISAADLALNQAPLSVTYQGSPSHDYYASSPYDWSNNMPSPCGNTYCDGQVNPKADTGDFDESLKFGNAVRSLGLGYAFTGDMRYADKAIQLIRVWALDPATYMTPEVQKYSAVGNYITLSAAFYGADLIWNYPGWDLTEKQAFAKWAKDIGTYAATLYHVFYGGPNNWENWRQVFIAAAGVVAEDSSLVARAFNNYKTDLNAHMNEDGAFTQELVRTLSLNYSAFALNAMTQTAEIARHHGVDLYGYTVSGRNLELAWNFHAPYFLNPSSWPWQQISTFNGYNLGLYKMAYNWKQKSIYLNVMNKYSGVMNNLLVMGPVDLTHAFSADSAPIPPPQSPYSGPNPVSLGPGIIEIKKAFFNSN